MKFSVLSLFIFFIFLGCEYQKDSLNPLNPEEQRSAPGATEGDLDSNLSSFFAKYVVKKDGTPFEEAPDYENPVGYDSAVDYQKIFAVKSTPEYRALRDSIINHIKTPGIIDGLSQAEKIAFYINVYNFLAIDIVIENSSNSLITSIADLGGQRSFKAFSDSQNYGYWVARHEKKLSLDKIEKDILAKLVTGTDARLHFAVICASKGCPVLLHIPYNGADLDQQLDFITRAGLNLPRMLETTSSQTLLSEIFNWYKSDFSKDARERGARGTPNELVESFVRRYVGDQVPYHTNQIGYVTYDWTLNSPDTGVIP